jgi:hypothetical protein
MRRNCQKHWTMPTIKNKKGLFTHPNPFTLMMEMVRNMVQMKQTSAFNQNILQDICKGVLNLDKFQKQNICNDGDDHNDDNNSNDTYRRR